MRSIIKNIIIENQREILQITPFQREMVLDDSSNYIFTGLKYVGKTFLMFQHIQSLIKRGKASIDDILYINFDDERLSTIAEKDLNQIILSYKELYDRQPIVFLDEIPRVKGWVNFARRLADAKYRVFITGSNANMLSRDIEIKLNGRYIVKQLFPFSFFEYTNATGGSIETKYSDYLDYGGLAEVFDVKCKRDWVNALYQKVLLSNIVSQNNNSDIISTRLFMRKIAESVTQPITQYRLQQIIRLAGTHIPLSRISQIVNTLKDTYLVFGLSNYISINRGKTQKFYLYDNGLLNIFISDGGRKSILLENLVAIEFAKEYGRQKTFYYQHNGVSIDFYIPHIKLAVQTFSDITNRCDENSPEVKALVEFNTQYYVDRAIVITLEESKVIEVGDLTIECIPVWKWLCQPTVVIIPSAR